MFTYSIKTMGCKANIYDSLVMERELTEIGGLRDDTAPDVFVLNSCTVTSEADKRCQREVAQIKKRSPNTWALVTGCYAQVAEESVQKDPNVDQVITNEAKSTLKRAVAERFGIQVETTASDPEIYWGQLPMSVGKTRAFIKIQEGCNDFCTYCIIPYARGKSRSVRMGLVLAEIERLAKAGVQEAVLTGTNIADYGKEFGVTLEDLIDAILAHTSIARLRLTSLDPTEISERILDVMSGNPRLMPHLHVSLQSPVSRVLRAMKRDYREEEVIDALTRISRRGQHIFVGMDVIAGFPSETDEEHRHGVELLKRLPWTRLHVFPYSEREGTPATRIAGSVPMEKRKRRAKELMALSHERHRERVERLHGTVINEVLFESWHEAGGDYFAVGHAANYMRVMARLPSRTLIEAQGLLNRVGDVRVVGSSPKPSQDWTLEGAYLAESI